jgi:hypothetical protein
MNRFKAKMYASLQHSEQIKKMILVFYSLFSVGFVFGGFGLFGGRLVGFGLLLGRLFGFRGPLFSGLFWFGLFGFGLFGFLGRLSFGRLLRLSGFTVFGFALLGLRGGLF